jgi:WD40 repeat protein
MDVRWSPDGGKWATASIDGTAKVWDAQSGKELATLHVGEAADTVEFSRDGRRVLTLSSGSAARIWDAQNGAMLAPPIRHDGLVRAEFSPDGLAVATASRDRTARAWDAKTGQPLTPSLAHQDEVLQASFSPAGHCLLTVSSDHTVRLWELAVGGPSFELGSQLPVTGLALSPDQHRVLTASRDGLLGRAQLWDLRTGAAIGSPIQHLRALSEVAFSADGRRVLTASFDTTARVWETDTGQAVTPPLTHQEGVAHAAFSPDGQRVATGSLDKTAMVWEVPAGRPITPPLRHDREVQWVAFSPDGQRLVTGCRDRRAYVWDVATGTELLRLNAHRDWVLQSVFSPDGRQILTASTDGTARLWDAATGMALSALRHLGIVKTASFSADGKRVVTASYDRTARIWEADTGRAVTPPLNHEGWVEQAAFSDDGRWVVTACADGTARLWSASDGGPVASAIRLGASVRDVFLSKDGQALVAGGGCVAAVWHWAKAEQSLADLESMARLLTGQETDPQGRVVMVRGEDLKQLWQTFRAKPAQPAPLAVPSWHQRALAQALDRRDTYAVRFHLNPLLERTPGDVRLLGLRARLASSEAGSLEGEWTLTEPFAESRSHVPPRAAGTPVNLIDLSDYYNRPLTESGAWEGPMELYNLSSLPRGIQTLARVKFDLRGWVILAGTRDASLYLPKRVSGIKVGGRCRRIHFLHATAYPADPEKKIATYMIHYADGACAERPMIYGRDVQNFKWQNESELKEQPEAVCAWTGTNYLTAEMGYRYRLYKSVWENPRPDVAVERIDLESSLAGSGPFLIAISAE